MYYVRNGQFETNSSSCHQLCICEDGPIDQKRYWYKIPEKIEMNADTFGWEFLKYRSPEKKLSYLYTGCLCSIRHGEYNPADKELGEKYKQILIDKLHDFGIMEVIVNAPEEHFYYYIDHWDDYFGIIAELICDKERLFDFLFAYDSILYLGNDNSECCSWQEEGLFDLEDNDSFFYGTKEEFMKGGRNV